MRKKTRRGKKTDLRGSEGGSKMDLNERREESASERGGVLFFVFFFNVYVGNVVRNRRPNPGSNSNFRSSTTEQQSSLNFKKEEARTRQVNTAIQHKRLFRAGVSARRGSAHFSPLAAMAGSNLCRSHVNYI